MINESTDYFKMFPLLQPIIKNPETQKEKQQIVTCKRQFENFALDFASVLD